MHAHKNKQTHDSCTSSYVYPSINAYVHVCLHPSIHT